VYNHCPTYCATIYSNEAKARLRALIGIMPSVVEGGRGGVICTLMEVYMEEPVPRKSCNSAVNYCQFRLLVCTVYSACSQTNVIFSVSRCTVRVATKHFSILRSNIGLIIYVPVVYMARDVMILMQVN
jgi:hypothetical protein